MISNSFNRSNDKSELSPDEQALEQVVKPIILGLTGLAAVSFFLLVLTQLTTQTGLVLSAVGLIVMLALTALTRYGHLALAARLLVVSLAFLIALSTIPFGGIYAPQNMLFVAIIMLAYMLPGNRYGNVTVLFTIGWLSFLLISAYLEAPWTRSWLSNIRPIGYMFTGVTSILATVAISRVTNNAIQSALNDANSKTTDLQRQIALNKRIESNLRQSNERFETLVNNTDAVFWLADSKTFKPVYVSPAFETIMGMKLEEAYQSDFFLKRLHPDEREHHRKHARNHIDISGSRLDTEFRVVTASGKTKWIWERVWQQVSQDTGNIILAGLSLDITERVMQRQQLNESQELLQLVIDNMPARISFVDQALNLRFVNHETVDETSLNVKELYQLENFAKLEPYLTAALAGKGQKFTTRLRQQQTDMMRHFRLQYVPYVVKDAVQGVFTFSWDITEEVQTQQALGQKQKLESLGVMAGGIAHDFNNLLVAMLGQASLAQRKLAEDHPAKRHVAKAVLAAERASVLTQQMLAYSGKGQFEIRPININQLIDQNLRLFQSSAGSANIKLHTSLSDDLPALMADEAQMQQVVMNLIINAAQAVREPSGLIEIASSHRFLSSKDVEYSRYSGQVLASGKYVCIRVSDNGMGMTESTMQSIFEPFFTTKESGSGLGLAAVLGIVRGHNGGIAVTSKLDSGTTFELVLPASAHKAAPKPALTLDSHQEVFEPVILVIDDQVSVGEAVVDMLEAESIGAHFVSSGKEGIRYYKQNKHAISLVLLDLSMPEMNGHDVLDALREYDPLVKIVLSSGFNKQEATQHFTSLDLVGFLQKPYDFQQLISTVRAHF